MRTIGFFEDDGLVPVTPETRAAVNAAAQALREAGFRVEPFRPRTLGTIAETVVAFFVQCGAMFYEPAIAGKRERLSPIFSEFLEIAESTPPLTAVELLDAWAEIDLLRAKMLDEMREYSVLLCPVASIPAFRPWRAHVAYSKAARLTIWTQCGIRSGLTLLAAPAAVVPVGRSPEGLPIGVQIAARPFEDEIALGVAAIVDAAFGYQAAGDRASALIKSSVKFIRHRQLFIAPVKTKWQVRQDARFAPPTLDGGARCTIAVV